MLTKFPNVIIDKKDSALINAIFYLKLKGIMEYQRLVSHQQFSSKGGRVKHRSSDNHGPAAKISRGIEKDADEDAIEAVDMASYAENVNFFYMFAVILVLLKVLGLCTL